MNQRERVFILVEKDYSSGLVTVHHRAWQDQLTITATPDYPEEIGLIGKLEFDPRVIYIQYPPVQPEDNNQLNHLFRLDELRKHIIRAYLAKILN